MSSASSDTYLLVSAIIGNVCGCKKLEEFEQCPKRRGNASKYNWKVRKRLGGRSHRHQT